MHIIVRLLLSLLIIVGVGAGALTATKALLSDQAVLTANTFSTGTVDLQVSSGKTSPFGDSVDGFKVTKMLPGATDTEFFRLKNIGDVDLAITAQAASISGDLNANDITITITPVDSLYHPIVGSTPITHSLHEWETPTSLGIPNISHGGTSGTIQRYQADVTISSGVTTGGASSIFDFIFTGTQTP